MTALPDCPHCALPVGEGDCAGCRNVRTTELLDAQEAIDGAPIDAAWLRAILGDEWRDSLDLRGLVVLVDRALAANPLNPAAVDRLLAECSDAEREQVSGSATPWCSARSCAAASRTDSPGSPSAIR